MTGYRKKDCPGFFCPFGIFGMDPESTFIFLYQGRPLSSNIFFLEKLDLLPGQGDVYGRHQLVFPRHSPAIRRGANVGRNLFLPTQSIDGLLKVRLSYFVLDTKLES